MTDGFWSRFLGLADQPSAQPLDRSAALAAIGAPDPRGAGGYADMAGNAARRELMFKQPSEQAALMMQPAPQTASMDEDAVLTDAPLMYGQGEAIIANSRRPLPKDAAHDQIRARLDDLADEARALQAQLEPRAPYPKGRQR